MHKKCRFMVLCVYSNLASFTIETMIMTKISIYCYVFFLCGRIVQQRAKPVPQQQVELIAPGDDDDSWLEGCF